LSLSCTSYGGQSNWPVTPVQCSTRIYAVDLLSAFDDRVYACEAWCMILRTKEIISLHCIVNCGLVMDTRVFCNWDCHFKAYAKVLLLYCLFQVPVNTRTQWCP